MTRHRLFIALLLGACLPVFLDAGYTIKDSKIVDTSKVATMSLDQHYNAGVAAFEVANWHEAARQFTIVSFSFPLSPYGQEAFFYLGIANYNLAEYDLADEAFSAYLEGKSNPTLFEEAMEYKFHIAEKFRNGARRRLMGTRKLPKWASGEGHAIKIYDEVIAAVPTHELAVQSLCSKGLLHWSRREYGNAVECFQLITRRFPKHELTPECYLMINRVYLDQSRNEFQNPDILALAHINTQRFHQSFPREERLGEAERDVLAIKEVYAGGLYETGSFYERVGYPNASVLYYRSAALQFPETKTAAMSASRLRTLGYPLEATQGDEIEAAAELELEAVESKQMDNL